MDVSIELLSEEWLEPVFALLGSDPRVAFQDWERDCIRSSLHAHDSVHLVATAGDTLVGVLIGGGTVRGYVNHLIVAPDSRGRGIGSLLLKNAIKHFRAKGKMRVILTVTPENTEPGMALDFYRTHGFEQQVGEVTVELDLIPTSATI